MPTTAAKKAATTKSASDYTARHLSVLEGLEAVRKRPGMYIGSTDSRGLMHCLWEIIDNAVDEALGGHCDRDRRASCTPTARSRCTTTAAASRSTPSRKTGLTGVEVVFTKLHAGGKFGGGSYAASGGLHGVGACVVNALSARLDVEVDRGGKTYAMSFRRGEPGRLRRRAGAGRRAPTPPFTPFTDALRAARRRQGQARRHRHPGPLLGRPRRSSSRDAAFAYDELVTRARQTVVPGARPDHRRARRARLTGTPGEPARTRRSSVHDGGIAEFVEFLAPDPPVTDVWRLQGTGTFTRDRPGARRHAAT